MRPGIHPDYRPVVFRDGSAGTAFLTRSTASGHGTVHWDDGGTYPVVDVDVSAASHPFWTGRSRVLDAEGAVARFHRRYPSTGTTGTTGSAEQVAGAGTA